MKKDWMDDDCDIDGFSLYDSSIEHHLKIMFDRYIDIKKGRKTFEIRLNDRNYQVNDTLVLFPINKPDFFNIDYEPLLVKVVYIDNYEQKENYVVLGIKE